jgi:plastocyanin
MIWLLRIFFRPVKGGSGSALAAMVVTCCCAWAPSGVSVTGQVELVNSRDPAVRKHKDYSGVVVWLEPVDGSVPPASSRTAQMVQKDKRFIPHVLPIQVGTRVDFPNYDPIFHNAFSNFAGQPFDVGLYPPGTSQKVRFRRDGIVRVFCNIHPTMSAVIVVLKTPYFAVSARSGAFALEGVPPGEYLLQLFHERSPEAALKNLARKIVVGADGLQLPVLRVSESGYIQTPHKNKYGQDYPPVADERPGYSGEKRRYYRVDRAETHRRYYHPESGGGGESQLPGL